MAEPESRKALNIVLVHGGFVDGSGWEGVYNILRKDGYTVAVVQNPTVSLADDVAVTRRVIAAQDGYLLLDSSKFHDSFAADDRMIPPAAQRFMAERAGSNVSEVSGSHAVYVSQPEAVAALIKQAAGGVKAAAASE